MKISASCYEGRLSLRLQGEIDHHSAKEMMNKIAIAMDDYMPRETILDFSDLSFMDSSGIAIILRVMRRARECDGKMWVENPRLQPLKVIEAAGIDRVVEIKYTAKEGRR